MFFECCGISFAYTRFKAVRLPRSELATCRVGRVAESSLAEIRSRTRVGRVELRHSKYVAALNSREEIGGALVYIYIIARVQYSMRHACSTMLLGHANVRKTCTTTAVTGFKQQCCSAFDGGHCCANPAAQLVAPSQSSSSTHRPHRMQLWLDCGRKSRENRAALVRNAAEPRPPSPCIFSDSHTKNVRLPLPSEARWEPPRSIILHICPQLFSCDY